jgi:hypothetical protein
MSRRVEHDTHGITVNQNKVIKWLFFLVLIRSNKRFQSKNERARVIYKIGSVQRYGKERPFLKPNGNFSEDPLWSEAPIRIFQLDVIVSSVLRCGFNSILPWSLLALGICIA